MVSSVIFWKFSGEGLTSPLPKPLPRFFSGFALGSGFALNSRALRALDSGFALDTRALRALDSGFALNFRLVTFVWSPQNKFLDTPLGVRTSVTLCDKGRGGQNWPKKRYVIVERPQRCLSWATVSWPRLSITIQRHFPNVDILAKRLSD